MNPDAMDPFGLALLAYFEGNPRAELIIRREDGREWPLPVSFFYRGPSEYTPIEKTRTRNAAAVFRTARWLA